MTSKTRLGMLIGRALLGTACVASLGASASPAAAPAARAAAAAPSAPASAARPNIVVILADDMGFSDIQPFGSEVPTPTLDMMAQHGLRFTQFYNTPRCSPSRASLLTGLYPHEAGMGQLDNVVKPESLGLHGKLDDRAVTLAQVLHSAGYFTAMTGKWNVGTNNGTPPWKKGFDRSLETRGGTYFKGEKGHDYAYIDGVKHSTTEDVVGKGDWYASDLFVDWQTKFFHEAMAQKKPFFLYMPMTNVHFPVMAPADEIAKYKGKYMAGWDPMRQARYERQKKMGIIDPNEPLPPPLKYQYDWSKLTPAQKDRYDTMMAVYAADIARMDKAIGTLVQRLKDAGQLDNTLILFMADNGGNAEGGPDGASNGPGPLGSVNSNIFIGLNWATLTNTPFQYFKHYTEEGGISSPFIAFWPKGIDPKLNGSLVRAPSHLVDVMPTLAQLAGATYPTSFNGHAILPEEGRSIVPAFHGQALTRSAPLFWEHEGNRAVRDGDWKLVAQFHAPWELYNVAHDRSEMKNLASANPQIVAKMSAEYDAWTKRAFVDTWPNKVAGGVTYGKLAGIASGGQPPASKKGKNKKKGGGEGGEENGD